MEGTIIKILHGQYSVDVDGVVYQTSPRGLFRHRYIKPIVGDRVILDENNYLINEVLPRKSSLKRPAIANINQILLVFSLSEPCFSYYLALKYLTYAHYEGIKASLVLTKTDIDNLDDGQKIKNDFERFDRAKESARAARKRAGRIARPDKAERGFLSPDEERYRIAEISARG